MLLYHLGMSQYYLFWNVACHSVDPFQNVEKVMCFGAFGKIGKLKNVIVTFLIVSFFERIRPDAESIFIELD